MFARLKFCGALVVAAASFLATPSLACRVNLDPAQRVSDEFAGVAIGVVDHVWTADGPEGHPWGASLWMIGAVEGTAGPRRQIIGRSGSSAECDDGQPAAHLGEVWVLYLWRNPETGRVRAAHSYPLAMAQKIDARFARRPGGR